jgi:hypothetical protein
MRTDVSVGAEYSAGAGVGVTLESTAVNPPKLGLDDALAVKGVATEPGSVPGRVTRDTRNVIEGVFGQGLGASSGVSDNRPPVPRATSVPLVMDAGDSEVTRNVDLGNVFNSGV